MSAITAIQAREILNSRGLPTIECRVWLDTGLMAESSVSTGRDSSDQAAIIVEDGDEQRMLGHGMLTAVNGINQQIAPALIGQDPTKQTVIDQILIDLDGTPKKSKLGANAILAVSQAVLKAGAYSVQMPLYYYLQQKYQLTESFYLPTGVFSMINGGINGTNNLDLKDFLIIPAGHMVYPKALNLAVTFFHQLEEVLITKEAIYSVGHVGGYSPNLYANTDAFEILIETAKTTPYTFAQDLFLGVDVAASNIYQDDRYPLKDRKQPFTHDEMMTYYQKLRTNYQVIYIEAPFVEKSHKDWRKLTAELGGTTNIVGTQLLVTNNKQLQAAINDQVANTIAINPIQLGTISETIEVIQTAKHAGWKVVIADRSGETNDSLLADLAVGVGANFVKFGAPNRGERVAKYNRLLEIYQQLNPSAV